MVRLRHDVEGCACVRCQGIRGEVLRRSLADTLLWSSRLVTDRPSILAVFLGVGCVQLLALLGPPGFAAIGALLGVFGVFLGRGYIGVVGRAQLGGRDLPARHGLVTSLRRFPAFLGAVLLVVSLLAAAGLFVVVVLPDPSRAALGAIGLDPFTIDLLLVLVLAGTIVYALVKFWFVPEACFVGGYGPVAALRASWTVTTLHRRKALLIVGGYALLLGVGVVLDTRLADPESPIVLSFRYGETTIVLRSFGLSFAGGVRFVFDTAVTALYSGVFVHQYVSSALGPEQ